MPCSPAATAVIGRRPFGQWHRWGEVEGAERTLRVDNASIHHGELGFGLTNFFVRNAEVVLRQHGKVGKLPNIQFSLAAFFAREPRVAVRVQRKRPGPVQTMFWWIDCRAA